MKYTREQIRGKAIVALRAKKQGDLRWLDLVLRLSVHTGLAPAAVEARIRALAD